MLFSLVDLSIQTSIDEKEDKYGRWVSLKCASVYCDSCGSVDIRCYGDSSILVVPVISIVALVVLMKVILMAI